MTKSKAMALLAVMLALGACNTPTDFAPITRATDGSTIVIGPNVASSSVNGVVLNDMTLNSLGAAAPGFIQAYNGTNRVAFRGESSSGDMRTLVLVTDGALTNMGFAAYSQESASVLPTSGSATLTGNYVGLFGLTSTTDWDNDYASYMYGTASITANFASNAVSGTITNRLLEGLTPASDINLAAASIGAGARYAGVATSGAFTGSYTGTTGSYEGMFGADGTETAGAVKMFYSNGATTILELGTFIAE